MWPDSLGSRWLECFARILRSGRLGPEKWPYVAGQTKRGHHRLRSIQPCFRINLFSKLGHISHNKLLGLHQPPNKCCAWHNPLMDLLLSKMAGTGKLMGRVVKTLETTRVRHRNRKPRYPHFYIKCTNANICGQQNHNSRCDRYFREVLITTTIA